MQFHHRLFAKVHQQSSLFSVVFANASGSLGKYMCSKENTVRPFRTRLVTMKDKMSEHKLPKDMCMGICMGNFQFCNRKLCIYSLISE